MSTKSITAEMRRIACGGGFMADVGQDLSATLENYAYLAKNLAGGESGDGRVMRRPEANLL